MPQAAVSLQAYQPPQPRLTQRPTEIPAYLLVQVHQIISRLLSRLRSQSRSGGPWFNLPKVIPCGLELVYSERLTEKAQLPRPCDGLGAVAYEELAEDVVDVL